MASATNPPPSPFEFWLEQNAGYYNTVQVTILSLDEDVRQMYRIPYQGTFIFSTNHQTHHPQLSRDDVRIMSTRLFPLPNDVVVLEYNLLSRVLLPSGHFTVPYNLIEGLNP